MLENARRLVAIVDDDMSVRTAIASLLKANGIEVEGFSSARAFLSSAQMRETGCVTLDLRMPGMDGLELQRHLAGTDPQIQIVFVTAYRTAEIHEEAMRAGAIAVVSKPFSEEELVSAIRLAFETGTKRSN